jgi:hypothetical protein
MLAMSQTNPGIDDRCACQNQATGSSEISGRNAPGFDGGWVLTEILMITHDNARNCIPNAARLSVDEITIALIEGF